eukprot:CAMPEP_0170360256 /NCGR_PEP_ID=MMETSP0117_2-20130122/3186_1 /TAXON_ID=400756 /ORGANISM="Durinskia baltica, Strain CSIRO CS-38" /LENGTH=30 /DNA_ID= /DNA_START= /DNA_END= /DNA_ORIENTATION=
MLNAGFSPMAAARDCDLRGESGARTVCNSD